MLFVLRPFRIGEYIETASLKGYVGAIGLSSSETKTDDGLYLMAPNSTLWNSPIVNHSRGPDRRLQLSIAVGNDVDVGKVKNIVKPVLSDEMHVKKDRAPWVYAGDLSADKTTSKTEYWAATRGCTETRHDLIDILKSAPTDAGIPLK